MAPTSQGQSFACHHGKRSKTHVNPQVARAAGLPKGYPATFGTASGEAQGETVPRQSVTIGGLRIDGVTIAVIDGVGEVGLLGQNILRH